MIIREEFQGESVEDFAAYLGAYHEAEGLPLQENFLGSPSEVADNLRLIYELSYEQEKEEAILWYTSEHTATAVVQNWNELHGIGSLLMFLHHEVFFCYSNLPYEDPQPKKGDLLDVTYKYDNSDIVILTAKHKTQGQ